MIEDGHVCCHKEFQPEFNISIFCSGKGKRLRQAKEEATAEIDHYRLQREKEFRHKQSNVSKTLISIIKLVA